MWTFPDERNRSTFNPPRTIFQVHLFIFVQKYVHLLSLEPMYFCPVRANGQPMPTCADDPVKPSNRSLRLWDMRTRLDGLPRSRDDKSRDEGPTKPRIDCAECHSNGDNAEVLELDSRARSPDFALSRRR